MKWIAIGVAAVIAAAVIVIVDLPIYQQPKPSTGNANTKPQTDLTTSQSKTNPTGLPGNAYTNPPIDAMGMMHFHPHLTLIIDSKPATVPANIGIDPQLFQDHSFDSNGMTGMAPLHTHDTSGTIHVESYKNQYYILQDFLNIWGLDLNGYKVSMTVNGQPVQNYKEYILKDGDQIVLSLQTIQP